jgi:hypothetical protein
VEGLTIVALLVYLVTVYCAWHAYHATTSYVAPSPARLEAYLGLPAPAVKRALVRALVESYVTLDAPMLASKFRWTRRTTRRRGTGPRADRHLGPRLAPQEAAEVQAAARRARPPVPNPAPRGSRGTVRAGLAYPFRAATSPAGEPRGRSCP